MYDGSAAVASTRAPFIVAANLGVRGRTGVRCRVSIGAVAATWRGNG